MGVYAFTSCDTKAILTVTPLPIEFAIKPRPVKEPRMILPSHAEVVELAQNGALLEAIFSNRWHCRYQQLDAMAQLLADAHNKGHVDLLGTLSASGLATFSGYKGYHGRRVYSLAMERLDTSLTALLPAFKILAAQTDGEPHEVTETFRVWCSASPNRPRELLALVDAGEIGVCDFYSLHMPFALGSKQTRPTSQNGLTL